MTADVKRETEEILNTILPPREWEEDGQMWRQCVSTNPATRLDVVNLQEQLDMRLQQRQVKTLLTKKYTEAENNAFLTFRHEKRVFVQ